MITVSNSSIPNHSGLIRFKIVSLKNKIRSFRGVAENSATPLLTTYEKNRSHCVTCFKLINLDKSQISVVLLLLGSLCLATISHYLTIVVLLSLAFHSFRSENLHLLQTSQEKALVPSSL